MLVSDCQKYFTLKYKKGLIQNGMFKYTRNPNYLGCLYIKAKFQCMEVLGFLQEIILFGVF